MSIRELVEELKRKAMINQTEYALVIAEELENILKNDEFLFLLAIISRRISVDDYHKLLRFLGFDKK